MRIVLASKVRKQSAELNLEFGLHKNGKIVFRFDILTEMPLYKLYCLTTVS